MGRGTSVCLLVQQARHKVSLYSYILQYYIPVCGSDYGSHLHSNPIF